MRRDGPGALDGGQQPVNAVAACGDHRHHVDAEPLGEQRRVNLQAVRFCLVEHVQGQHRPHAQIGQLQGEEQRAAQILGVRDLDHRARRVAVVEQHVPRYTLVVAVAAQGIRPGRIEDRRAIRQRPTRHLNRRAGVVRYGDVAAREAAKDDRFAHVGIPDQDDRRGVLGAVISRRGGLWFYRVAACGAHASQ